MAIYNITNLTSATTVSGVALFANDVSNGLLFGFGLIGIFFILLLSLMRYDFAYNMLASSFVAFILGGFLAFGGFVSIMYPLGFLLLLILSALYVYMVR